jgi:SOS response regulatory protein OraA/RecX
LKFELAQKGVEKELAEAAVQPVAGIEQQMTAARHLAAKKFQALKNEPELGKASRKMTNYLLRKGYDSDVATDITREFFGDPTEG